MNVADVREKFESEVSRISQRALVDLIRKLQVEPRLEQRDWDYGREPTSFPCWIVVEHRASNTCVAYCEHGFGPASPWGLLFITGQHTSMGMDCGWFSRLEDAVRNSMAWDGPNPLGYEVPG